MNDITRTIQADGKNHTVTTVAGDTGTITLDGHGEDAVEEAFMLGVAQGLKQAQEWRPIETAPKDGTRVLLLGRGMRHADGHWESKAYNGNGCWVWPYVKAEPRNWMPLPPSPREDGDE